MQWYDAIPERQFLDFLSDPGSSRTGAGGGIALNRKGIRTWLALGLATTEGLHPIQEGFHLTHAPHCGFCTPGMMTGAIEMLEKNPDPTEEEIRWGISGNLCRCTGYNNIVRAIQWASAKMRGSELPNTAARPSFFGVSWRGRPYWRNAYDPDVRADLRATWRQNPSVVIGYRTQDSLDLDLLRAFENRQKIGRFTVY